MSELKYKVGDRVQIKSIDWYNEMLAIKDKQAYRTASNGCEFIGVWCANRIFKNDMIKFCGQVMTIKAIENEYYVMHEDTSGYWYCDEMIECKVEEETKPEPKFKVGDILFYRGETSGYLKVEEIRVENGEIRYYETSRNVYLVENDPDVFADKVCSVETEETKPIDLTVKGEETKERIEITIPEGYEYVIEYGKIIFTKKKKEYPKTYEECCDVLSIPSYYKLRYYTYEHGYNEYTTSKKLCLLQDKLNRLSKLLICRDAYWKLYGEEMGLDCPWAPDWNDEKQDKYGFYNEVKYTIINPAIFVFPTEEMRDAFKDNFKKEIEICKELL